MCTPWCLLTCLSHGPPPSCLRCLHCPSSLLCEHVKHAVQCCHSCAMCSHPYCNECFLLAATLPCLVSMLLTASLGATRACHSFCQLGTQSSALLVSSQPSHILCSNKHSMAEATRRDRNQSDGMQSRASCAVQSTARLKITGGIETPSPLDTE